MRGVVLDGDVFLEGGTMKQRIKNSLRWRRSRAPRSFGALRRLVRSRMPLREPIASGDYAAADEGIWLPLAEQGNPRRRVLPRHNVRQRRRRAARLHAGRVSGSAMPSTTTAPPRTRTSPVQCTPSRSSLSAGCTKTFKAGRRTTSKRSSGPQGRRIRVSHAQFNLGVMYENGQGTPQGLHAGPHVV